MLRERYRKYFLQLDDTSAEEAKGMFYYSSTIYCANNSKATFPVEAPPTQVDVNVPVGHTALAARTHPSHLPLLTLIVAPASTALRLNNAVPDAPEVDVGAPPHFVILPAMPPQIAS